MEMLSSESNASLKDQVGRLKTDEQIMSFTGLTYGQLDELAVEVTHMRNSTARSDF